jgi:integrase
MELQPLKIHFYLKQRDKGNKVCELYMRMVLSGRRTDISLSYPLKRDVWDEKEQTLKLKHPDRSYVLGLTNKYRQKAMEEYQQLIQRGMAYDINIIRQKITGYNADDPFSEPSLLRLFNRVIDRKIKMLGQKNTKGTIQKYNRCRKHLTDLIKKQYHTDDIRFNHITLEFIEDFELYLKTDGECCHNTTMKHIQTLKTIYKNAMAHGYTDRNPFEKYKISMQEVIRNYLNEDEIKRLIEYVPGSTRLSNVRDLFLFCCFMGLAYIDLKNLSVKHIQMENNKYWIRTRRQKTNIKTNVPLLDIPLKIVGDHCPNLELRDANEQIFKVISNQKMNNYLKDLARECQIQKELTFHIARHTFATTVTLNNGCQ